MSIPKNKWRVSVTLGKPTKQCMDSIIAANNGNLTTYSKIIDVAITVFYMALLNNTEEDKKGDLN